VKGGLPDYLAPGLRLVFVGINPGLRSAATGHHYAGRGNHFWPLLFESGLVRQRLGYEDDARVLEFGIGLTNLVQRPSRSLTDLSTAEMRAGAAALRRKLLSYRPLVACFNGRSIYEVFAGRRGAPLGEQAEGLGLTSLFVMPSTSARTAAYQRGDKLAFFRDLRRLVERRAAEAGR
jgi:mismatch-specific thymine-DNA glycosylase